MVKQETQEQLQKSHEQDILQKYPQINQSINQSIFASYWMHAMNFCVSLEIVMHQGRRTQDAEVTKLLLWLTSFRTVGQTRNETLLVVFSQTVQDSPVE